MSENLRRYTRAVYALDAVANRVDPETWEAASPCAQWSAREVLGHASGVADLVTAMATGEAPTRQDPGEIAGDDPVGAWAASRERVLAELDRPGVLAAKRQSPFGEMTVDDFLGIIWVDPLTHAWDLATATGQPHGMSGDLADQARATLENLGDGIRSDRGFAAAVEGEWDDPVAEFIAFAGRDPLGNVAAQ